MSNSDPSKPDLFVVTQDDLDRLERVSKRLFTEDRLDGNQMRDLAQVLQSVIRNCKEVPVP